MPSASTPASDARYREVARTLRELIESGELEPGARLPSERALAEQHGLSRMTARQGVELLVRQGLAYRRPGSGTYVAPARVEHSLQRLAGFSEQLRTQGLEPSGRVLSVSLLTITDGDVASALRLAAGERAWAVRRVRYGDGQPLAVERFHVPQRTCADLSRHDLELGSLYEILRTAYGVHPARAHETIEPTACEPDEARLLQTRVGAPALLVVRTTYDREGRPIEFARDLYRGDRTRFVIDLRS